MSGQVTCARCGQRDNPPYARCICGQTEVAVAQYRATPWFPPSPAASRAIAFRIGVSLVARVQNELWRELRRSINAIEAATGQRPSFEVQQLMYRRLAERVCHVRAAMEATVAQHSHCNFVVEPSATVSSRPASM